ncbi:MAG: phenylacetate--CoA ligase family protein [Lautropia sp.]
MTQASDGPAGLRAAAPAPAAERDAGSLRLERLRRQLQYCFESSEFYRQRFSAIGFDPAGLRSFEEFGRLDFRMSKLDERQSEEESLERFGHPLGMHLCADPADVVGISASSGTTGQPTFTYLFTKADLDVNNEVWRRALGWMGVSEGALVLHAMGLSMWVLGGLAVHSLINIGMRPLPVGAEGGVTRILQIAARTGPSVLLATPSMAERLLEQAESTVGRPARALGIRKILCIGEPGAGLPAVRSRLESGFDAQLYDGMVGAWGICQVSCSAPEYAGMHQLTEDFVIWELVDPVTYEPLPKVDGARGRVLVTTLSQQARPIVKFDMGDICEVYTSVCACGSRHPRIRVLGRADDMLIVRGVNVYPTAVKDVVMRFRPQVSGEVRIVLPAPPPRVAPPVRLLVEAADIASEDRAALAARIEQMIGDVLRFRAKVELVEEGSIVRATGKTRIVVVEPSGVA